MEISEENILNTTFNARHSYYAYIVVPSGLTNAPVASMTVMNDVLRRFVDNFVCCYFDDILVYSNPCDEHAHHTKLVL